MRKELDVAIVGAGIGGLAFACHLTAKGFRPRVFEKAEVLGEVGAGIQVSANGSRLLHRLGMGAVLQKIGHQPKRYVFRLYQSKEVLQSITLGDAHISAHGAPYYTFHRADLHSALLNFLERSLPGAVSLGSELVSFEEDADGVLLSFADGRQKRTEALVGADGIRSVVRPSIVGQAAPHFTGQCAWRISIPRDKAPQFFDPDEVTVWVAPGGHAVTYFVRGGEVLNFVGIRRNRMWTSESWTETAPWSSLRDDYLGWNDDIRALIDSVDVNECYRWALYGRDPMRSWSSMRVTLLGDAAHPTLPYMAQGAVMAIEDAAALSRAFETSSTVQGAFTAYETARIARTTRIVLESADNARLFQLESEAALKRAFAERNISGERNAWLYAYDANAAVDGLAS